MRRLMPNELWQVAQLAARLDGALVQFEGAARRREAERWRDLCDRNAGWRDEVVGRLIRPQVRCASSSSGGETVKVNILREGSDPPVLDDAEYPDWLWTVHEPLPSLQELTAKFEADPDSMTSVEHRRMTKLWNRARIKDKNAESAKS